MAAPAVEKKKKTGERSLIMDRKLLEEMLVLSLAAIKQRDQEYEEYEQEPNHLERADPTKACRERKFLNCRVTQRLKI